MASTGLTMSEVSCSILGVLVEHHSDSRFYKRIGLHQLAEAAALVLLHSFCFARIFLLQM